MRKFIAFLLMLIPLCVATPVFGGDICPASTGSSVRLNAVFNASKLDHFIWENQAAYNEARSKDAISGVSVKLKGKLWECGGNEGCGYGTVLKAPSGAVWKGNNVGNEFFWCRNYLDDQWQKIERCVGADGGYNVYKEQLKKANGGGFYYIENSGLYCVPDQKHAECIFGGKQWIKGSCIGNDAEKNTSNNTSNNSSNSTAEVDDPCASKLSGMNATEAEQKNNKCIATTCKNGYYKYKVKGTYQGYCVAKSVCNNSSNTKAGTTEVKIDDDYISCAKPEKPEEPEEPENPKPENPEEPTTNAPGTDEETPQNNPGTVVNATSGVGNKTISGVVYGKYSDGEEETLIGATVSLNGVKSGTLGVNIATTDNDGKFTLSGFDKSVTNLTVTHIGLKDATYTLNPNLTSETGIRIVLQENSDVLEEVVVSSCEKNDEKTGARTSAEIDGVCIPMFCMEGYEMQDKDGNVFNQSDECLGRNVEEADYGKCNKDVKCVKKVEKEIEKPEEKPEKGQLSEEDQKARVAELEENAKKMKEKEQSMENKLLGAAGMGMTGMGLMQSMSAGAEQKADEAAELDMAAYLATMHCNYAPGKNVQGGEKEVELPGANSLLPLYTEYVALANDLKVRKEALGMRPGIESEAILDGATSGLYDDVALGKTSGAYTSLARALSDPNGEDAKKWAAQKEETAKDKKTGTTLAAVGAIGSAVANIAINKNAPKESSEEIESKYDKKRVSADTSEKGDKDGVDGDNGNSGGVAPVPKNDKIADKKCDPACDANTHDCVDGVCVEKVKTCTGDQELVGGECKPKCGADETRDDSGECVKKIAEKKQKPDTCPSGQIFVPDGSGCDTRENVLARDKTEWYPHSGAGMKYYGDDFYQSGSDQKYKEYLSQVKDACEKAGGTFNRKMKILEKYKNRKGGYSTYLFTSCDFEEGDTSRGSMRCKNTFGKYNSTQDCSENGLYKCCEILAPKP